MPKPNPEPKPKPDPKPKPKPDPKPKPNPKPKPKPIPKQAALAMRPRRRVARVTFADGSACGCGDGCWLLEGGCCDGMDEWRRARRRRGGDGGGDGGGGGGGAGGDGSAQADEASLSSLERACAHAARPPLTAQGDEAAPCPQPNASYAKSKPGGAKLVVSWVSRAPHPVRLSVLDYAGNELVMATLKKAGIRGRVRGLRVKPNPKPNPSP